ncbi:hypothetical protein PBY51_006140 [Eleginops maclovinus]|uniref:Uncharacterized protein n=1 Tax=Eleginops maclovinus TaxID=56733 RepID=A0AAN7WTV2_ELEMC|nr:hypothetical protein PBY51_006140 [Eleginops maclovinus]
MLPSNQLKTVGLMPWERYVTTYSRDYQPFSERQPQVNQPKSRTEAQAAPGFISTPQAQSEAWPIFHQNFYKTSNSIYGSGLQPPYCSIFPAYLHPFGSVLGDEAKGRLHCVFDGKVNVLEQQEAKDEPQQKIDVLYEEGVIVLSSHVGPACCEGLLRSVCREAGLPHLLYLPEASRPIITLKDAEHCDSSAYWRCWGPATGVTNSSFLQPTSSSCYAWDSEHPNSYFKIQTCLPSSGTLPPAHEQPTFYCTEPSRRLPMTEYQDRYSAEWAQPKMQQRGLLHRH